MKTLFQSLETVLGDTIDKVRILYTLQTWMGFSVSDTVLVCDEILSRVWCVLSKTCETQYSIKLNTYFMNHFCPINFKVYHDPKCRYRFGMAELNYDTRMCEFGLHSHKIQFAGKSECTSLCMLVLNQRWRRVWTNQKFASLVCSPTHRAWCNI